MKTPKFKIVKVQEGKDTPCKECAFYWFNGFCYGDCTLPADEIYDFTDDEYWKKPFGFGNNLKK